MSDIEADNQVRDLVVDLGDLLMKDPLNWKREEVRQFVRANRHVGDFWSLAKTMILLCDGDVQLQEQRRDRGLPRSLL